jgi:hypothetical protein
MGRAQGLSINVLIIVVLALLVLIVLAAITAQKMGFLVQNTNNCEKQGGKCFSTTACGEGSAVASPIDMPAQCSNTKNICCASIR